MSERFSFVTSAERLKQQFPALEKSENLRISYNIAPTNHSYVITNDKPDRLQYLIWGLIPSWSRDGANSGKLITVRDEGIEVKPSFRLPIRKKRCLVLADSFYEWRKIGNQKVPYRVILKKGDLMVMAGVWDSWFDGDYEVKSFSIITTAANKEMKKLSDRMPVLLNKSAQEKWLDDITLAEALELLVPAADGSLKMYRISDKVNSPQNNSLDLHQELPEAPTLF